MGPDSPERLVASFLEAKRGTCLPSTLKTYGWALKWLTDCYRVLPQSPRQVREFVELQRHLRPRSLDLLYMILRVFYNWSEDLPDLPPVPLSHWRKASFKKLRKRKQRRRGR